MICYYALWIPTKNNITLIPTLTCQEKDLLDSFYLGGYHIKCNIDELSKDISFSYKKKYGICSHSKGSFTLKYVNSNNRGIIIYSLEIIDADLDPLTTELNGKMNPSIYHLVKGFFHEHEYHSLNEDALLQAHASNSTIDLERDEKIIISDYINQYKNKFEDFLEYSLKEYQRAKNKINSLHQVNKGINGLRHLIEKGNTICGEIEYCKYLLKYARNKGWVSKSMSSEIYCSFKKIEALMKDISYSYNDSTAYLGIKYGQWGILFGILGIGVSVFTAFYSSQTSPKPIDENRFIHRIESANKSNYDSVINEYKDVKKEISMLKNILIKKK